jgi:hypothetical protein
MRQQRIQPRTSGSTRWWNLSLPVALAAVTLVASPAQAQPGVGFGGGNGDAVGSLPSEHGGGPGTGDHGVIDPVVDQYRLVLIGDSAQLDALVLLARKSSANAWLTEELLGNGLKRVVYGGDVALTIDRSVLESSFVAVQLELGPIFGGGALAISTGDGVVARTAAVPGTLPVHLQQLSSAAGGLLDAGIELRATTKAGKQRALSAVSSGPDGATLQLKLTD